MTLAADSDGFRVFVSIMENASRKPTKKVDKGDRFEEKRNKVCDKSMIEKVGAASRKGVRNTRYQK